jgi:hypothetical protein
MLFSRKGRNGCQQGRAQGLGSTLQDVESFIWRQRNQAFTGLLLFIGSASATIECQTPSSRDGRWWRSATVAERDGFVEGFADCYSFDVKGPGRFGQPVAKYRQSLDRLYADSMARGRLVPQMLLTVDEPLPARAKEHVPRKRPQGPFAGYTGLAWRNLRSEDGRTDGQLGFIEGLIECNNSLSHRASYSRPLSEYIAAINSMWHFDDQTSEIDEAAERMPIADALWTLRDRPKRSSSPE